MPISCAPHRNDGVTSRPPARARLRLSLAMKDSFCFWSPLLPFHVTLPREMRTLRVRVGTSSDREGGGPSREGNRRIEKSMMGGAGRNRHCPLWRSFNFSRRLSSDGVPCLGLRSSVSGREVALSAFSPPHMGAEGSIRSCLSGHAMLQLIHQPKFFKKKKEHWQCFLSSPRYPPPLGSYHCNEGYT